jgi:Lon protease-like protein
MSTSAIELPLFPLNVVLFPGMVLPLHIFEPRYRLMVSECQRENKPFGVVLARSESQHMREEPYLVGTMAEIRELDELEDGRFNIIAIGLQRFRILSQHREKPYLSGLVELYEDVSESEQKLGVAAKQAGDLFNTYLRMLFEAAGKKTMQVDLPTMPEELSHFIAYLLDMEVEQKQQLLEFTSTLQRLQEEIIVLRREVPFMRQMLSGSYSIGYPDRSILN